MQTGFFHSAWLSSEATLNSAGASSAIFPWWSFTKTVLSICALRLIEDHRLSLDELRPGRPFSLRQLLRHQAGLVDYGALGTYHQAVGRGDVPWSREHLLEAARADRLVFRPGTGWAYSNIGYMFVREIIEEAAALPLEAALRKLVLDPLSLETVRRATRKSDFAEVFWPELRSYDPGWVYHGCLIGTPVDAARLLHALFHGQLLKAGSLRMMLDRQELGGALPGRPWTDCGYGLGLMIGQMGDAGRAFGHSGSGPGCVNAVYHFSDRKEPITVASFTDGPHEGSAEFEAMAIALREAP